MKQTQTKEPEQGKKPAPDRAVNVQLPRSELPDLSGGGTKIPVDFKDSEAVEVPVNYQPNIIKVVFSYLGLR